MSVTPSQFAMLAKSMDAAQLRHRVIAHNIANVNTPGYRALTVEFEDELKKRLDDARAAGPAQEPDLESLAAEIQESTSPYFRVDQNNVDLNGELGRLNKNSLLFNAYTQILTNRLSAMRAAITSR